MLVKNLRCIKCGKEFSLQSLRTCTEHLPYYDYTDVVYDYEKIKKFPTEGGSPFRFSQLLPVESISITLGEGATPLVKLNGFMGFEKVYVKDESKNPTGSFKDREAMLLVNIALERGEKEVYIVSSGNAALALSAYAKKAGLKATCFVTETSTKMDFIKLYGYEIRSMPGTYEDTYRKVVDMKLSGMNCTPGSSPFNLEADKLIAFEMWEQMGVPDKVIVPCGNGTNLAGIWKGFKELKILGKTDKLPSMIAVQVKGASPLSSALKSGRDFEVLGRAPDSVAEGIVATESYSSPKALLAIKESGGCVIEVNDSDVKEVSDSVKEIGLNPEPTSMVVFSALSMVQAGKNEKIACVVTGDREKSNNHSLNNKLANNSGLNKLPLL